MVESRKGSSFTDLQNHADNGASLDELLDIVRSMDDPNDLYNVMDLCAGDSYEDNLLWNTAKTKRDTILSMTERKGSCGHCERPDNLNTIAQSVVSGMSRKIGEPSRKGAPAFATGNSGKLMSDVKGFINNDTVSTKLQKTFGTEDQRNQAILKEHNNNQAKIDRQNKVDQLRNGQRLGFVELAPSIKQQYTSPGSEIQEPDQGYNNEQIDTLKFETAYSALQSVEGTYGLTMSDTTKLANVLKDKVTVSYGSRSKDEYDEDIDLVQLIGNIDVSGEELERIASQNGLDYYIDPSLTNGL